MRGNQKNALLAGLQQLVAGAFPKTCPSCGRTYKDFEQFIRETRPLEQHSGLKEIEDKGNVSVEVYRNCPCGSTLMDMACDRRDESENGRRRRVRFESVVQLLIKEGLSREQARIEVLLAIRGIDSPVLNRLLKNGR